MHITKKHIYIYIFNFTLIVVSLLSGLYIISNVNIAHGYELLYLLPLSFGLCFVLLLSRPLAISKSIFLWTFMIFATLRYIALPTLMTYQNFYTGYAIYQPHASSIQKGILLMVYEILVAAILIRLIYKRNLCNLDVDRKEKTKINNYLINHKLVYLTIIFLAIFILIIDRQAIQGISFFNIFNRNSAEQNQTFTVLSRQFIMLGKILLYFLITEKLYIKHLTSGKRKYIWLIYIFSFLNIGIFIGVNRKRILMNAIASIFTINFLYPKQRKKTAVVMLMLAFIIFSQLTMFRFYSNSYNNPMNDSANTLQVYLSGPYNMAIAVETREEYKADISGFNVIYDIVRPFYGIGTYFKRYDTYLSTEYFNRRLSIGGPQRSDQIMPITGQGLLHFGYLFSPIYLILAIILGVYTEKKLRKTSSFEKRYILVLICTMFGQAMGVNFTIIVNFITFEGILFYFAHWLNLKIILKNDRAVSNRYLVNKIDI